MELWHQLLLKSTGLVDVDAERQSGRTNGRVGQQQLRRQPKRLHGDAGGGGDWPVMDAVDCWSGQPKKGTARPPNDDGAGLLVAAVADDGDG